MVCKTPGYKINVIPNFMQFITGDIFFKTHVQFVVAFYII